MSCSFGIRAQSSINAEFSQGSLISICKSFGWNQTVNNEEVYHLNNDAVQDSYAYFHFALPIMQNISRLVIGFRWKSSFFMILFSELPSVMSRI